MGGGDEGGKKTCDPSGNQGQNGVMKPFRGETRAIEVHPGKPIHLGIKKAWASVEVCPAKIAARSLWIRTCLDDLSALNDDVYDRLCSWNFPSNDHGGLSVELYKISGCFKISQFRSFIDNYLKIL
jgi:hypothetical protein